LSDYLKTSQELAPDYTFEIYVNGEQVLTQHVTSAGIQPFLLTKKGSEVGATIRFTLSSTVAARFMFPPRLNTSRATKKCKHKQRRI